MAVMTATPMDTVKAFLGLYESRRLEAMRDLCDPGIRWLNERSGEWERGVEPLIEWTRAGLEGATEMRAELNDTVAYEAGDQAVISGQLLYHGIWDGQAYDIPCPTTFLLRRSGDDWKIAYEHALEYRPRTEG